MSFSISEAAMSDAFVEWINTFEHKDHDVDSLVELTDGVILSQVLQEIDPTWFKALSPVTDTSDNWMLRFNNLKKLHKLIVRYYEEILGQDIESIPSVNLNAIAKDADTKDLLRLCQLVVALAVQSDNNNMYIEMIQSLTQKSQHALMVSIEEYLFTVAASSIANAKLFPNSQQYQAEFEKLVKERKALEVSQKKLLQQYEELRVRNVCCHRRSLYVWIGKPRINTPLIIIGGFGGG
ncbi:hypothetical protein BGW37DRAFT_428270 [Umbelopsis sp. PMI_123]|nr:hypothetical protein BGW37DRAFT_428270 [Umbelopsis sp. PMI_123]